MLLFAPRVACCRRGDEIPKSSCKGGVVARLKGCCAPLPSPSRSSSSACFNSFSYLKVQQLLGGAETHPTRDRSAVPSPKSRRAEGGAQGERHPSAWPPPAMPPPAKKSDVEHPLKSLPYVLGDSPTSPWGQPRRGCAGSGGCISVLMLKPGIFHSGQTPALFFFFKSMGNVGKNFLDFGDFSGK